MNPAKFHMMAAVVKVNILGFFQYKTIAIAHITV